jgi:hypothetical protein
LREADTLELATAAGGRVDDGTVVVEGAGVTLETEPDAVTRSLAQLARCVIRHGGIDGVRLDVAGGSFTLSPVPEGAGPVVLADDLRDLVAAVAGRVVRALGGSVSLAGDALLIRLPA